MMKSEPQARDQVLRGPSGVAVVVAFVPPMDLRGMTGSGTDFPALDFQADLASSVSPINFVSPGDPLTLLVHGDADKVVPISHSSAFTTR